MVPIMGTARTYAPVDRSRDEIRCARCQKSFNPSRAAQRFCSADCRLNVVREKPNVKCLVCGTSFKPYRHAQRMCSEACRNRRQSRSQTLVAGDKNERRCVNCGNLYQPRRWDQKTCGGSCPGRSSLSRTCQFCGKNFVVVPRIGDRMQYCSKSCRERARKRRVGERFRRYGMTLAEYSALVDAQGNLCLICEEEPPNSDRYGLVVDHDHGTGVIRGLLCNRCNLGVGLFDDDPEKLKKAIKYLVAARPA